MNTGNNNKNLLGFCLRVCLCLILLFGAGGCGDVRKEQAEPGRAGTGQTDLGQAGQGQAGQAQNGQGQTSEGQTGEGRNGPGLTDQGQAGPEEAGTQPQGSTAGSATRAQVDRVVDGDTIKVRINGTSATVRLIGVNTPEVHHPKKPVEAYGREAGDYTRSRLDGKTIWLTADAGEQDKYGRLLRYVWLKPPKDFSFGEAKQSMFNAELVAKGYAQVMTVPPDVAYADLFLSLQREARTAAKGLWSAAAQTEKAQPAQTGKTGRSAVQAEQAAQTQPGSNAVSEQGPHGETIKGNINSRGEKIYHVPGGRNYRQTIPEQWFFTEAAAKAAGFRKSSQ